MKRTRQADFDIQENNHKRMIMFEFHQTINKSIINR